MLVTLPVVVRWPAEFDRPMTRTGPCQTGYSATSFEPALSLWRGNLVDYCYVIGRGGKRQSRHPLKRQRQILVGVVGNAWDGCGTNSAPVGDAHYLRQTISSNTLHFFLLQNRPSSVSATLARGAEPIPAGIDGPATDGQCRRLSPRPRGCVTPPIVPRMPPPLRFSHMARGAAPPNVGAGENPE